MKRQFGSIKRRERPGRRPKLEASYLPPDWAADKYGPLPERIVKSFDVGQQVDAEAWLAKAKREIDLGTWEPPQAAQARHSAQMMTFHQYAEDYIRRRRTPSGEPLARGTREKYMDYVHNLDQAFGDKPMDQITPADIQQWYDGVHVWSDKQGRHGESGRAHIYNTFLRAVFKQAATVPLTKGGTDTLIPRSPCTIKVPNPPTQHVKRIAEADEIHALHEAMPDWCALAVYIGGVMDLREGEVAGICRGDIDLEGRQLHVRHAVKTYHDPVTGKRELALETTLKTRASQRTLPIPDFLLPIIEAHLERFTADSPDATVFTSPADGGLVAGQTLRNALARAIRQAAPRLKGMTFHDLRDTALSHYAEAGASLGTLMAFAGHTNLATASVYQQPSRSNQQLAVTGIEAAYKGDGTVKAVTPGTHASQPVDGRDVIGQLERLGGLHSDGVLTDEEFIVAKKRVLGL